MIGHDREKTGSGRSVARLRCAGISWFSEWCAQV